MSHLLLRAIFAIFIFSLASSQSNAACAWILWSKSFHAHPVPGEKAMETAWEPYAYETRRECESAKNQWLNRKAGQNQIIEKEPDSLVFRTKDTNKFETMLFLKCLPDTVKPE